VTWRLGSRTRGPTQRDISMSGSATLVRWLLANGLLDQLDLWSPNRRARASACSRHPTHPCGCCRRTFSTGVLSLAYALQHGAAVAAHRLARLLAGRPLTHRRIAIVREIICRVDSNAAYSRSCRYAVDGSGTSPSRYVSLRCDRSRAASRHRD
jgi:hypothetical protein